MSVLNLMGVIRRTGTAASATSVTHATPITVSVRCPASNTRGQRRTLCQGKPWSDVPVEVIKEKVFHLGGGQVDLKLDNRGLARLTLENGDKKNALSGRMMCQLHDRAQELTSLVDDHKVKCVLICSQDNVNKEGSVKEKLVCSGGDLDVVRAIMNPQAGRHGNNASTTDFYRNIIYSVP